MDFDTVDQVDPHDAMKKVLDELNFDKSLGDYTAEIDEFTVFVLNKTLTPKPLTTNLSHKATWNALMDAETSRVICCSTWTSTISALCELLNTTPWYNFSYGVTVPRTLLSSESWSYQYNTIENKLIQTYSELTAEKVYRFKLIQEKAAALDMVHSFIASYRKSQLKDLPLQPEIYIEKFRQAKEVFKKKIQEDQKHVYPFVTDYAMLKSISLQEAAQEIFFKFKSYTHKLSDTENIRIKYTNLIRDEQDIRLVHKIANDFEKECKLYGKI